MSKIIDTWIKNVKTYPPAKIFFKKYGKEAKSEKRIQDLCEEVYRFCFPEGTKNPLSDLGQSYREFEVAYILGFEGMKKNIFKMLKINFLKMLSMLLKY